MPMKEILHVEYDPETAKLMCRTTNDFLLALGGVEYARAQVLALNVAPTFQKRVLSAESLPPHLTGKA